MKEKLLAFFKNKNFAKIIFIVGLAGILLIFASSLFPKTEKSATKPVVEFSEANYLNELESGIKELVSGICGDPNPVVKITLETGLVYEYATETKKNNATDSQKVSEESQKTYITVKDQSGSEVPLVVTEHLPEIRGVAVICNAASEEIILKIEDAVCAALNVGSRQIYIGRKLN